MNATSLKNKIILLLLITVGLVAIDRITKELAKEYLMNKEPKSYFGDVFRLEYAENTGAFLSLGDNLDKTVSFWVFSIIPLLVLIGLLYYIFKEAKNMTRLQSFALILIFSGGIGNIIDRIMYDRHVTDFMNMGIGNLRTGIFNFADLYLTTGVIVLLFTYPGKSKKENVDPGPAE